MYEYVSKAAVKPARKICMAVLTDVKGRLQAEGLNVKICPVGSASMNLVTRNGNAPFDVDFDLRVLPINIELRALKNKTLTAVKSVASSYGFQTIQDSTSAITCIHHQDDSGEVDFHMDIGIVVMKDRVSGCRLIHDKTKNLYVLNEPVHYKELEQRKNAIKQWHLKEELRKVYLEKKNNYLKNGDPYHPSFVVYAEAVNQVYQKFSDKEEQKMAKGKVSGATHTQAQMNHHANQGNPNNAAHKAAANNHANQMNPNHSASKTGKK